MSRHRKHPSDQEYRDAQANWFAALRPEQLAILPERSNAPIQRILSPSSSETMNEVPEDAEVRGDHEGDLAEEIFDAIMLIVPFSCLLVLMEILVRMQYARTATLAQILDRLLNGVPIVSILIFYTTRYKSIRLMQFIMLLGSMGAGGRLIYQLNNANWLRVIQQGPPLATLWVYSIFQLDLRFAVLGLALLAVWTWLSGLSVAF